MYENEHRNQQKDRAKALVVTVLIFGILLFGSLYWKEVKTLFKSSDNNKSQVLRMRTEPKNRGIEESRNRRTEEPKNRGIEELKNQHRTHRLVIGTKSIKELGRYFTSEV